MSHNTIAIVIAFAAAGLMTVRAAAQDATIPGEVTTPYPTIINLAVVWEIEGDDNLNGVVTVRFREVGEQDWREAMPLRRVPAGQSKDAQRLFTWSNKHSGSIFDLRPDTEYEIALKLTDPDGGDAEKTVQARTRPVPAAAADAPIRRVNPQTINDPVEPGEILLLEPGDYGDFIARRSGRPGQPIVYRAAGPGVNFRTVSLQDRRHVHVEGLTIRPGEGNRMPAVQLLGAQDCVVRRCDIEGIYGVRASAPPGATRCYVADNVIQGTTPWTNETMGAGGQNVGMGIELTGPGNVIAHNRVTGFRDCITLMEDRYVHEQICIDIYNNDIYVGADDAIEADFSQGNVRVMRNRITNSFVGISSQPGLGGPTYFIRNVMYNLTYAPYKLHRWSEGDVILHNTVIKTGDGMACFSGRPFDHALFRNNLAIGGPPGDILWGGYGGGTGLAAGLMNIGENNDIDYSALGTWNMPFAGRIGEQHFDSIETLRQGPHEKNAIQIDMSVFDGVDFPDAPLTEYDPPDLRPRPGSAVVDAGQPIPNINDDFTGNAPDIGAYEAGQPLPIYGPRPEGIDEATAADPRAGTARQ
jgi:hypothetical protein